ncbi:MAG: hypothetical protein RLZZ450_3997 [Pseudomonadota bacterium]
MAETDPSFFARLALAFAAFFRVLFNAAYAGRVLRLANGDAPVSAPVPDRAPVAPPTPEPPKLREVPTDSALQLLGLLQREGRLIDFLQEDVSNYSDAEIGAAARVVHASVNKALAAHVALERVRGEAEGSRVSVQSGFSAHEIRLTGHVVGEAPFTGTLAHAGWRAVNIELPKLSPGYDVRVLAPAEVEL